MIFLLKCRTETTQVCESFYYPQFYTSVAIVVRRPDNYCTHPLSEHVADSPSAYGFGSG